MPQNRIDETFSSLRKEGKKAFMPFVTAGDPDLPTTAQALAALGRAGADLVELGIPFSDPIADGPTIQASFTRALAKELKFADTADAIKEVRSAFTKPIVFMVTYTIVHRIGPGKFASEAARAGADGLIVPDLPVEESAELTQRAHAENLHLIHLIAPTTTSKRRNKIIEESTGFIYYVSLTGVTGERDRLPAQLAQGVAAVKAETDVPVCVGFGISRPEQAREVARIADGVIVGSALVKILAKLSEGDTHALKEYEETANALAQAIKSV